MMPNPKVDDSVLQLAELVMLFRLEREELSLSCATFGSLGMTHDGWRACILHLLRNPKWHDRLQRTNVVNAISMTTKLNICCYNEMGIFKGILSWWSIMYHNFMISWGEITFALKSMVILLGLSYFEAKNIYNLSFQRWDWHPQTFGSWS